VEKSAIYDFLVVIASLRALNLRINRDFLSFQSGGIIYDRESESSFLK